MTEKTVIEEIWENIQKNKMRSEQALRGRCSSRHKERWLQPFGKNKSQDEYRR